MGDTHSWTRRPLGSFCEIKGGKRLPKGDGFATNKTAYPYIRVTDFGNFTVDVAQLKYLRADTQAAISRYIITKDDVYISIAGTTAVVGMVPEELNGANLTENAARVVINCRDAVLPRYLMFFLASELAQDYLKSQTLKNAQPKLALVRIKSIPVPVPPVAEQRQIARLLSAVQRAIERQERLIALTAELKKALMHQLFTEGTRGEPLKQTEIGPLPESWDVVKLGDAVSYIDYGISAPIPKTVPPEGVKIVSTADITKDGELLSQKVRRIVAPSRTVQRLTLNNGDALFNRRNSSELIGKSVVF